MLQPPPGQAVQEVELLNPFNLQETLDDKLSVLDIKARDQAGRQFNVEMQILGKDRYSGIAGRLRQPSIVRAVEELTMLTQSDIERERYDSRRKAQMDHLSAINAARLQGELAGQEKGELIGRERGSRLAKLGSATCARAC